MIAVAVEIIKADNFFFIQLGSAPNNTTRQIQLNEQYCFKQGQGHLSPVIET